MIRITRSVSINNIKNFKQNALHWAQQFHEAIWLDSNNHAQKDSSYDAILAVDALTAIRTDERDAFARLEEYREVTADWIFGYLTYDLKNDIENLTSANFDGLDFPALSFFQPKKIIFLKGKELIFQYLPLVADELEEDIKILTEVSLQPEQQSETDRPPIKIKLRIHKDEYQDKVSKMLQHIHRGDIYEANFCQEFYAGGIELDTVKTYHQLNSISKPPFATYLKLGNHFLMSATPERFLKKTGNHLISQPIKGTARRAATEEEDKALIRHLESDPKERSENIMIVDLVRNDLSRVARKGTVNVDELCKVYTFEQVHQMISTVSAQVESDTEPVSIIKACFPMGSMTGAPKIAAMQIIETLEETKRGLYSGAVGYFTPAGDFDFNVIIRSILYNKATGYVSFSVGSAITALSDPEKEYEECLIKAKAMRQVLEGAAVFEE